MFDFLLDPMGFVPTISMWQAVQAKSPPNYCKLLQITSIIKHSGQDLLKELYWSTFPQFPTLYFIVELMFSFIKSWKTSRTFEPFCYTPKLAREMSLHSIWSTFFVNFLNAKWDNLGPIWDISTIDLAEIIKLHSLPYEINGLEGITPK